MWPIRLLKAFGPTARPADHGSPIGMTIFELTTLLLLVVAIVGWLNAKTLKMPHGVAMLYLGVVVAFFWSHCAARHLVLLWLNASPAWCRTSISARLS